MTEPTTAPVTPPAPDRFVGDDQTAAAPDPLEAPVEAVDPVLEPAEPVSTEDPLEPAGDQPA